MAERPWEDGEEEDVNFLREMILSSTSGYGLLGSLALGALLSIPLGLGIGALPLLGFAAVESIAALFVPSSPVFRERILREKRRASRDATRSHLLSELRGRTRPEAHQWAAYERMRQRIQSLSVLAAGQKTGLTDRDVERLEDATVDYLGLWLAWLVLTDRHRNTDKRSIQSKLRTVERELAGDHRAVERRRLEQARADLEGILSRRQSVWARATSLEAAMLAMVDTFEEVYQRVVANPGSGELARELTDAVERMRVEEALDLAVDEELDDLFRRRRRRRASVAQGQAS
ncbi:MAG TPA: hypothetical protein ENK18_17310 [Deltaproteobacteria bacterium]|nr:hypothetical protein [Deltaproteobacteria bacterium]